MTKLKWSEKTLPSGIKQFVNVDEDLGTELMMLPTDLALLSDKSFAPWVKKYADDKDLFFDHFSTAFSKLLELGIKRDSEGKITNTDNTKGGYHSAPKKGDTAGAPSKSNTEADPLKKENDKFKARL